MKHRCWDCGKEYHCEDGPPFCFHNLSDPKSIPAIQCRPCYDKANGIEPAEPTGADEMRAAGAPRLL